jgi:predicted DNA-binding ribbon-helix-helix protein
MAPVKRSLTIAGHRTSLSLEAAFWQAAKEIAAAQNISLARLIGQIDKARGASNLSSAVRVFVLEHYRSAAAGDGAASNAD